MLTGCVISAHAPELGDFDWAQVDSAQAVSGTIKIEVNQTQLPEQTKHPAAVWRKSCLQNVNNNPVKGETKDNRERPDSRLAQHLMKHGDQDQAIEYVEHALMLKPDSQVWSWPVICQGTYWHLTA